MAPSHVRESSLPSQLAETSFELPLPLPPPVGLAPIVALRAADAPPLDAAGRLREMRARSVWFVRGDDAPADDLRALLDEPL